MVRCLRLHILWIWSSAVTGRILQQHDDQTELTRRSTVDNISGAGVFLMDSGGEVAVIGQTSDGGFNDFGGSMSKDIDSSDPAQTAVRELNEETAGLVSSPHADLHRYLDIPDLSGGDSRYRLYFACGASEGLTRKTFLEERARLVHAGADEHFLETSRVAHVKVSDLFAAVEQAGDTPKGEVQVDEVNCGDECNSIQISGRLHDAVTQYIGTGAKLSNICELS